MTLNVIFVDTKPGINQCEDIMQHSIIELAEIHLAPGKTESDLVAASDKFQNGFLRHQPGFLRRDLLRGAEGVYFDLVLWENQAAVDAVMVKVMTSEECLAYFAVMQMDAVSPEAGIRHMDVLAAYPTEAGTAWSGGKPA